jgi:hypothetical protein
LSAVNAYADGVAACGATDDGTVVVDLNTSIVTTAVVDCDAILEGAVVLALNTNAA